MKNILIVDPVCPKPYTDETLESEPMGGTEATAVRIALGFAHSYYSVTFLQRGRTNRVSREHGNLVFDSLDSTEELKPDVIIVLRDAGVYNNFKNKYPLAKSVLWLHDVVSGDYRQHLIQHLLNNHADIVTVSDWHKSQVASQIYPLLNPTLVKVKRIYNPVVTNYEGLEDIQVDPFKLVFFSSPHKGLEYAVQLFFKLLEKDSRYKLYIANPGYYESRLYDHPQIINMETRCHEEIINHVKRSLCTFYPNTTFEETFGLVLAESNAVGTPVIAQAIGAAPEVLEHPNQLVDCTNPQVVIDTVLKWTKGERPIVGKRTAFSSIEVLKAWKKYLNLI